MIAKLEIIRISLDKRLLSLPLFACAHKDFAGSKIIELVLILWDIIIP